MARDLQVNILASSAQFEADVKRMEPSARGLHAQASSASSPKALSTPT
jgi:hypothetical protein